MNCRIFPDCKCAIVLLLFIIPLRTLPQYAEDIWCSPIELANQIESGKPVVIIPFSTSNCGYCLIDGYFGEANYINTNNSYGGFSYHQCLFNPQLDIVSFSKHFHWDGKILNYPPDLHKYHEDGFPTLLAFRNRQQILRDYYNYDNFDSLASLLWDENAIMTPVSEMHMATRFIYENEKFDAICVFPENYVITDEDKRQGERFNAYRCCNINRLSDDDRKKHLLFRGKFDWNEIAGFFEGQQTPLKFGNHRIYFGDYSFNPDSTGIRAWFPNPYNTNKYLILSWINPNSSSALQNNNLDYLAYTGKGNEAKNLLYGHYETDEKGIPYFSDKKAFSDIDKKSLCTGKCAVPVKTEPEKNAPYEIENYNKAASAGTLFTLGNRPCHFPAICATQDHGCMVCWEEEGNILLAKIGQDKKVQTWFVENDRSNSYNPLITGCENQIWIFYLNNKDGYYRLYGKSFDGIRFSEEFLFSGKGPFDVISPAVVSNQTKTGIAWSEWKANFRFMKYLEIQNNILGEIINVKPAPSQYTDDYVNAWSPSLVYDKDNNLWGAWNQHYPASFGIFGGLLSDTAKPITRAAEKMDDWETGGYPCLFTGPDGIARVVYESNAWNVYYNDDEQAVNYTVYDEKTGKWGLGMPVTLPGKTALNQTPAGLFTSDGKEIIVWSGRDLQEKSHWGIYLSYKADGGWNEPVLISDPAEHARFPKISHGGGKTWISWHGGQGNEMKVKVLEYH